jgi:dCMP deaminase
VGAHNEIRAIGDNGFPRGADDDLEARHARPAKHKWTEHAERNAIFAAARAGIPIDGCTMYLPWFPCMDCARDRTERNCDVGRVSSRYIAPHLG